MQQEEKFFVYILQSLPPTKAVYQLDWETFSINWNTNVKASFLLAKYALTAPVKSGTGIIFISSGAAIGGSPISGGYAGSKRT
jgi:NAD(P)-dependent dehydrogenase (short-subunit alcohol dehydrogenase family)